MSKSPFESDTSRRNVAPRSIAKQQPTKRGASTAKKSSTKSTASKSPATSLPLQRISGCVVRVRYASPDGEYVILSLRTAGGQVISLKGAPGCQLTEGKRVFCDASESVHEKYGRQFETALIQEEMPQTDEGVVMYLTNEVDGIGPELALRLVSHFGAAGIFNIIETTPDRLAEVDGVGQKRIDAIKASWDSNALLRSLLSSLGSFGITANKAMRIIDQFDVRALEVVRDNPYELTCIKGIGFKTADDIALSVGLPRNSPYRLKGGVSHVIEETEDGGNTAVPRQQVIKSVLKLTGLDSGHTDEIESVIDEMLKSRSLYERRIGGNKCLSLAVNVYYEKGIAKRLRELIEHGSVNQKMADAAGEAAQSLGDVDQIAAVRMAFLNPVSVITGRPGCGKTTVTRFIVDAAMQNGLKVRLCAPTGKAARRVREATGYNAETVHTMLGFSGGGFTFNKNHPLVGDVFVLDEGSMLDTEAAHAFFSAVPDGARVIIVGDVDQLPSVGAGNVLFDIIAAGRVAVSCLHTVHRTALDSEIVVNAHHIINGRQDEIDLAGKRDFRFDAAVEDAEIIDRLLREYEHYGNQFGYENIQVLTSRRGTETGTHKLNDFLRRVANPPAPGRKTMEVAKRLLREGDRVMQTKNSRRLDIANGEIGTVVGFDFESKTCQVKFIDKVVAMNKYEANDLELAYASTVHRSQGSEFPVVLVVMAKAHKYMFNRNLLYTAVTRGKRMVHIIGGRDCVRGAIWKLGANRLTGLQKEILEEMPVNTVVPSENRKAMVSGVMRTKVQPAGDAALNPPGLFKTSTGQGDVGQAVVPPPVPAVRGSQEDSGVVKAKQVTSFADLLALGKKGN